MEIVDKALIKAIRLVAYEGPQGRHFVPNNLSDSEKQILEIQALIVMYDSLIAETPVEPQNERGDNNDKRYI